jgi:hypothetical protein
MTRSRESHSDGNPDGSTSQDPAAAPASDDAVTAAPANHVDSVPTTAEAPCVETDAACIFCGYNLRGLSTEGRCPECGEEVAETIEFAERWVLGRQGRAALVGSFLLKCGPMGFGGALAAGLLAADGGSFFGILALVLGGGACVAWLLGPAVLLGLAGCVHPTPSGRIPVALCCLTYSVICPLVALGYAVGNQSGPGWGPLTMALSLMPVALAVVYAILAREMHRLTAKLADEEATDEGGGGGSGAWLAVPFAAYGALPGVVSAMMMGLGAFGPILPDLHVLVVLGGSAYLLLSIAGAGIVLTAGMDLSQGVRRQRRKARRIVE